MLDPYRFVPPGETVVDLWSSPYHIDGRFRLDREQTAGIWRLATAAPMLSDQPTRPYVGATVLSSPEGPLGTSGYKDLRVRRGVVWIHGGKAREGAAVEALLMSLVPDRLRRELERHLHEPLPTDRGVR